MFKHVVPNTVLRDWLGSSVVGPTTEPYLKYLTHHGYAACTLENYLPCVAHFALWLGEQRITLHRMDEEAVHRFITVHLPVCRCAAPCPRTPANIRRALRHLLQVLRSEGYTPPKPVRIPEAVREELECFDTYLKEVCGLAEATRLYRAALRARVPGGSI